MTPINSCPQLMDYIQKVGFLPLLGCGIRGFSANEAVSPECRYHVHDDGSWEWPLWKWKGSIITESECMYGKFFFDGKAGFVSRQWWPDFCNWRRHRFPMPDDTSIEATILDTLRANGSMITRDLRAACGFTGPRMRSRFDGYVTRLERACRIVTEDFVYPHDRHGRPYGWGWALLTTPEQLIGADSCICNRTPQQSRDRIIQHLQKILPGVSYQTLTSLVNSQVF